MPETLITKTPPITSSFRIVAIGASVGGLDAISTLLTTIPSDTGMAFIVVQHLSPDHKSFLSALLSKVTNMKVKEVENMDRMLPNTVYVIPHDKIIEVTDGHIQLLPRPDNSSLTSIDILFTSLALTHQKEVIGIVLSGNAKDGTKGLKAIKKAGGITFAQDESAQASSMPQSAIASGYVDYILAPEAIATKITYLYKHKFIDKKRRETTILEDENDLGLHQILDLLLLKTGVDFNHYKMPTIKRRIKHKMTHCGIETIEKYIRYIEETENEIHELYLDLLIHVTGFFRDCEVFQYLYLSLFPQLLTQKTSNETLRIWVPACSTGQEAYSIAILLFELQEKSLNPIPIQLFATDLSEKSIRYARLGEFNEDEVKSIPDKLLTKYFTKTENKFIINKNVRESCVFAPHNILKDPPFSRMDFISCRNMLIYFDAIAQKKVFTTLHFALNSDGYIILGKAVTFGTSSSLFTPTNTKYKIYTRKNDTGIVKIPELIPRSHRMTFHNKKETILTNNSKPLEIDSAINQVLLQEYMPACVVVKKDMEIVQFRGHVAPFLEHPSGKASLNILKMTPPEIAYDLRNAINTVLKTREKVIKTDIEIIIDNRIKHITFEVSLLNTKDVDPLILIVFNTSHETLDTTAEINTSEQQKDKRLKKITEELQIARAEMNSIIEEQEVTYEELQTANEEIVSSNEEFQTLNEELETSKEEIEATNEELISTNHELQIRHDRLTEAHAYSQTIFETIHEPILILDKNLSVKSANKSYFEKFKVNNDQVENQCFFELGNKQWDNALLKKMLTSIFLKQGSFENFKLTHNFPEIGEKTMLLNARLIIQKTNSEKLILLAIEDITEQSRFYLKENLVRKKAEEKFRGFLESAPDAIIIADITGEIQLINSQTEKLFGYTKKELIGQKIELLIPERYTDKHIAHRKEFSKHASSRYMDVGLDLFGITKQGKEFPVEVSISQLETDEGLVVSAAIRDITEQKRISTELSLAKQVAEDAVKTKQQFLSNMSHEIRTPLNAIIGFTSVMQKTVLTHSQQKYIDAIKISGDTLIVLINDILDLAKVDAGKLIFENIPFKIERVIDTIIQIFASDIESKNLILIKQFDCTIPAILSGDAVRLNQILLNLVSNAVKFTSQGTITLATKLFKQDKATVTITFTVTDTGIGITKTAINSIFENFQQASSQTSRMYGGTGLGLAITKQLIEKQGGKIKVTSKIAKGSVFQFQLEFQKTTSQVIEQKQIEFDNKLGHLRILVAEDVALNQLLISTILEEFGAQKDIVSNGQEALDLLKTNTYDLILMDLQMPIMNGYETTEYIRKTMQSTIPIIALTADVSSEDLKKCTKSGMNDHVSKPINELDLYNTISRVMSPLLNKNPIEKSSTLINSCTYIDLAILSDRTNSKPNLLLEMLSLYILHTPPIVEALNEGLLNKDWELIHAAAHKLIPTFAIMGINQKYAEIAKRVVNYTTSKKQLNRVPKLVNELILICKLAVAECTVIHQTFKIDHD